MLPLVVNIVHTQFKIAEVRDENTYVVDVVQKSILISALKH